jgi:hypothetical protein|tara:strand:+ start:265 stop:924 length:660 start_codon:yes stop_codon:yes gene_type:complete
MGINVTPIPKLTEFATPAITFGTAAAAGTATSTVRSDSGLVAFNTSVPDAITFGQSGGAGAVNFASRIDHLHAMAANPVVDISCRAYNNANQTVADSTAVKMALNSEQFDTDTMHDTSTNNSRLTINTAGTYLCGFNTHGGGGAGHFKTYILLNNSTTIAVNETTHAAGGAIHQIGSTIYDFAEDDYIEMVVYQDSGGTITVYYDAYESPILWAIKIGS